MWGEGRKKNWEEEEGKIKIILNGKLLLLYFSVLAIK